MWRQHLTAEGSRVGIGIQVEGLTKSFGAQRIWEDVTFDIPPGEVSVLLGPSGTGKSVFLKSLIGLLRPERGSIIVDGTRRGHGYGRRLVAGLLGWSTTMGAASAYLQVERNNKTAIGLYESFGFRELYTYETQILD